MYEGKVMSGNSDNGGGRHTNRWRLVAWTAAATLLLLPLIAMQFTDEVAWNVADFLIFGVLLVGAGVTVELAMKMTSNTTYRVAVGVAVVAAFLLVWINGAVGIIGSEDNAANWMYAGVLGVGIVGAFIARFKPRGMALALFATAIAQAVVTLIAVIAGLGGAASGPMELLLLNGFFIALWLISGGLFRKAARGDSDS